MADPVLDKNGVPLAVGDTVTVACTVVAVHPGPAYGLVIVELAEDAGAHVQTREFGANSKQVVKTSAPPASSLQPPA